MKQIKVPIIVAEAGNAHEGNMRTALEMIEVAYGCGADLCKFQAGHAEDFARDKSQIGYYKKYDLGKEGYKKLWVHGNKIGIPVFFSIWSIDYEFLRYLEQWHKIPARQFNKKNVRIYDSEKTLFSVPYKTKNIKDYGIRQGIPMHCVTEYPTKEPHLGYIQYMRYSLGTEVGYSDHTKGINACLVAYFRYKAILLEKHFTLNHHSVGIRDHKFSANPEELRELVQRTKSKSNGIYGNNIRGG